MSAKTSRAAADSDSRFQTRVMNIRAVTLRELLETGETFVVPIFQREYVWEKPEWEALADDIEDSDEHYIGAVVLRQVGARDGKRLEIIDGQQRLTTLALAALAAVDLLRDAAQKGDIGATAKGEQIAADFLLNGGDFARPIAKLQWRDDREANAFWGNLIGNGAIARPGGRGAQKSRQRMLQAFLFFRERLQSIRDTRGGGDEAMIRFIARKTGENLVFALIVAKDSVNAHAVFETLNGRGRALGPQDLIKNYLLSKADNPKTVNARWRATQTEIGGGAGSMLSFLRADHNARRRLARKSEFYRRTVKMMEEESIDADEYIESLFALAPFYREMRSPTRPFWGSSFRAAHFVFAHLKARLCDPIWIAAKRAGFDDGDLARLAKACENLMVRRMICQPKSGPLEIKANEIAMDIEKRRLRDSQALARELRDPDICPRDEAFRRQFAEYATADERIARHLLEGIEAESRGEEPRRLPAAVVARVSREESAADRLGNYAMIEKEISVPEDFVIVREILTPSEIAAGVRPPPEALLEGQTPFFRESRFEFTASIRAPFDRAAIDSRQRDMAEIAVRVWNPGASENA